LKAAASARSSGAACFIASLSSQFNHPNHANHTYLIILPQDQASFPLLPA
jgi:hypothetical protein